MRGHVIRAFIAISVPSHISQRCQLIGDSLRELNLDCRFVKTRFIHLTLQFFGDVSEEKIPLIGKIMQETGREVVSFNLEVRKLGVFPNLSRPRIVWISVHPVDILGDLQKVLKERMRQIGFTCDGKLFHPHLTLLRLRSIRNSVALMEYVKEEGVGEQAGIFKVEEIHLCQSILKIDGAEYHKLVTTRLESEC